MTACGCEPETRRPTRGEAIEFLGYVAKATGLPETWAESLSEEELTEVVSLITEIADVLGDVYDMDCDFERTHRSLLADGEPVEVGPLSDQERANLANELDQAQRHAAWLGRPPLLEEIARPVLAAHGVVVGE